MSLHLVSLHLAATPTATVSTETRCKGSRPLFALAAAAASVFAFAAPVQAAVPAAVMQRALQALRCDAPDARILLVADMRQRNTAQRFAVYDLANPWQPAEVLATQVAHGVGSDPERTGWATRFSNTPDSLMTSLGAYHVAEQYVSHGTVRYRLDGESASDYLARPRNILLHVSDYVSPDSVGYSEGCFAISADAMGAMRKHFGGTLTNAFLWADGPGVRVPQCAANTAPWMLPVRACEAPSPWGKVS